MSKKKIKVKLDEKTYDLFEKLCEKNNISPEIALNLYISKAISKDSIEIDKNDFNENSINSVVELVDTIVTKISNINQQNNNENTSTETKLKKKETSKTTDSKKNLSSLVDEIFNNVVDLDR